MKIDKQQTFSSELFTSHCLHLLIVNWVSVLRVNLIAQALVAQNNAKWRRKRFPQNLFQKEYIQVMIKIRMFSDAMRLFQVSSCSKECEIDTQSEKQPVHSAYSHLPFHSTRIETKFFMHGSKNNETINNVASRWGTIAKLHKENIQMRRNNETNALQKVAFLP